MVVVLTVGPGREDVGLHEGQPQCLLPCCPQIVYGSGFRVPGLGCRIFRIWGSGIQAKDRTGAIQTSLGQGPEKLCYSVLVMQIQTVSPSS